MVMFYTGNSAQNSANTVEIYILAGALILVNYVSRTPLLMTPLVISLREYAFPDLPILLAYSTARPASGALHYKRIPFSRVRFYLRRYFIVF